MFHSSKRDNITTFVNNLSYKQQINLQIALSLASDPNLSRDKAKELAVVYWSDQQLADNLKKAIGPKEVLY